MRVLLLCVLAALPFGAPAQYSGPALDACRAFGERELKRDGVDVTSLAFDNDRHLLLERESRKLGAQAIGASLSGHGAIVRELGPAVEMTFLCLLANEHRALWFHWLPRRDAPALQQCRRSADAGACLEVLLNLAESDLVEAAAFRFQASLDADAKTGNDAASTAYRNAAAAWRSYRDLECARRGPAGSDAWRACRIDLTRWRYLDVQ